MRPDLNEQELVYLTINLCYAAMKSYGMFFYEHNTIFENMANSLTRRMCVKRVYVILKEINIGDYYNILLYPDQLREYSMVVIGEIIKAYELNKYTYATMLEDVKKEFRTSLAIYLNEIK